MQESPVAYGANSSQERVHRGERQKVRTLHFRRSVAQSLHAKRHSVVTLIPREYKVPRLNSSDFANSCGMRSTKVVTNREPPA